MSPGSSPGLGCGEPVRTWHLVAYDVRDDKRLRRVALLLEGYGERLQYSVFRCRLTPRTRADLLWRLARVLHPEDSLLVVPLCSRCEAAIVHHGGRLAWGPDPTHRIL